MSRYIDAELFSKNLMMQVYLADDEDFTKAFVKGMELVKKAEEETPTADVQEVKHGRWSHFLCYNTCSRCGSVYVHEYDDDAKIQDFAFCPFCGAKMDEDERE